MSEKTSIERVEERLNHNNVGKDIGNATLTALAGILDLIGLGNDFSNWVTNKSSINSGDIQNYINNAVSSVKYIAKDKLDQLDEKLAKLSNTFAKSGIQMQLLQRKVDTLRDQRNSVSKKLDEAQTQENLAKEASYQVDNLRSHQKGGYLASQIANQSKKLADKAIEKYKEINGELKL